MRLALAIRHVEFEDCGTLTEVLRARGFELRYIDAGRARFRDADAVAPDLLIGLGGPVSVYDARTYPWITDELKLFERRLKSGKPLIAFCLGAQMLAHALGARVFASPVKELGWMPLRLTADGEVSVVQPLGASFTSMLHWHGDTFDLPRGATLLGSTAEVENQIFRHGDSTLAFQCHPEVREADMESWLIGYASEVTATVGTSAEILRTETAKWAPALERQARLVFENWLASVGL